MTGIRPPAVAGAFYPSDPDELRQEIELMLDEAGMRGLESQPPKALIVPHAGYIYSGPVAASAYSLLEPVRQAISRVVLLGPSHRVPVDGLALPGADAFATPLGAVEIDREAVTSLSALPQVVELPEAHRWEHSLEVQLPFLLAVLDRFTLVPLSVGDATEQEVAEVLERLWGGAETLIVISSDLSHYLPYSSARTIDRNTADAIVGLRGPIGLDAACGAIPVSGMIEAARQHSLAARLLDLRNSGDTAGDKARVVGYGAFAFSARSAG